MLSYFIEKPLLVVAIVAMVVAAFYLHNLGHRRPFFVFFLGSAILLAIFAAVFWLDLI